MKCRFLLNYSFKKLILNRLLFMMVISSFFFCTGNLYAQTTVKGTVTSAEDGAVLPGVNVIVKGTNDGTITDIDGNYTITIGQGNILIFSSIGFKSQEIEPGTRSEIDIQLLPDVLELDEMVVIGYGSVRKSDLTGAVSSISPEELNPGANASIEQALQGRVAGVQINQNSNEPGGGMSVNIRGAGSITAGNEPLYVIDGMIVNNATVAASGGQGFNGSSPRNPLNSLNPADIQSIEILKDASSTAIYGSRGTNGVVLITTKKGEQGKMRVNYDAYYGVQQAAERFDLLSATEYRDVLNAIIADGGGDPGQVINEIEGDGTDWQDQVFQKAPTQNHNLSFSGATENLNYYSSVNYFSQDGLVKGSGMERYNIRLNLGSNADEKYNYGINMNASVIKDDFASTGNGINENGGAIYAAINYDPTIEPYNEDGTFVRSDFVNIDNPLSIISGEDAKGETFRFYGNTFFEYFIIPSLSAKVQVAGDVQTVRRDVFVQPWTLSGLGTGGLASIQTGRKDYYSAEGTLNYNKSFGDDNLSALLGITSEYYQTEAFSGNARGFPLPFLGTDAIGFGDATLNNLGSGRSQARFTSYLARVNYSINNKYLFTASIRADGSSRFGENEKFGFFPSGAIAWKMHEEDFLADVTWISQLKARASIGSAGNANIPNYLTFSTFSSGRALVFGETLYNTLTPVRLANPNLTWEQSVQYDFGIDFGFFNDRIFGSIDYFNKETTALLLNVPQAPNTGFPNQIQNLGGVRNQGIELALTAVAITTEDFSWNISANLATLKNEVLDIGDRGDIIRGRQSQIPDFSLVTPGEPLDSYYGFIVDGVWQEDDDFTVTESQVAPGDMKYRDINEDGVINADDRVIIGNTLPDLTWGLTNNLRFKDFTLDILLQGVEGVERLNGNLVNTFSPNDFRRNRIAEPLLNRWTPENPTNEYPSFVNPTSQGGANALINSRTVEDASYVRLQSVRFGYNVPVDNIKFLNRLSIYLTGQNLLTITDYTGVDPAANASGNNTVAIDFNAYPVPRTFLVGLNVEF